MLGNGKGRGIQLHACLMYDLGEKQIVGLAGALTNYRAFKPKNETRTQRLARKRESDVWGNLVEQIGPAPKDLQWIHVFDRGGDYFEAMCRIQRTKNDWVIRASKLNRNVLDCSGKKVKLSRRIKRTQDEAARGRKSVIAQGNVEIGHSAGQRRDCRRRPGWLPPGA